MAIDTTVGGASANSYVTLAEVQAYVDARSAVGWGSYSQYDAADDDAKEPAILEAALRLDRLPFVSGRATNTQAMKWPRLNARDDEGTLYPKDAIPIVVKNAQIETAIALVLDPQSITTDDNLSAFSSIQVGGGEVSVGLRGITTIQGEIPEAARRLLRGLIRTGGKTIRA